MKPMNTETTSLDETALCAEQVRSEFKDGERGRMGESRRL
jgi:hypothetical protein